MSQKTTRIVTFASTAFNTTKSKRYFIHSGCFGDDLCKWLIGALREPGLSTDDEPGQEDFGWYLNFRIDSKEYTFVVSYRPYDETWIGWVEWRRGLLGGRVWRTRSQHRFRCSRDLTCNLRQLGSNSASAVAPRI